MRDNVHLQKENQRNYKLYRKGTEQQLLNPYMVAQMIGKGQAEAMKEKLQGDTDESIAKLSEYAMKKGNFNYSYNKNEIQFKINQLNTKEKAEQAADRRKAQQKALELGYNIRDLDFYDKDILRKFLNPGQDDGMSSIQ